MNQGIQVLNAATTGATTLRSRPASQSTSPATSAIAAIHQSTGVPAPEITRRQVSLTAVQPSTPGLMSLTASSPIGRTITSQPDGLAL